ncbi:hypothetical protein MMC13_000147 [Lambiella insularis]|nr:hypothetical protein [Lambiella insularis]
MSRPVNVETGLEVVPVQASSDLELDDRYSGLQAVQEKPGNDLEAVINPPIQYKGDLQYTPLGAAGNGTYVGGPQEAAHRRSRKSWYICGIIVLVVVVVVAAVLGGVLGSRAHSSSTPATSPTVSTVNRLAALGFGSDHSRLYYQDEGTLQIQESQFNGGGASWTVTQHLGTAKNQTPIAAAGVGSGDGITINLFALSESGQLIDWSTTDGSTWKNGTLASQNIQPANFSNLASSWTGLFDNSSLLLVYQDTDSQFHLGNRTSDSWTFQSIPGNPVAGSGISLTMISQLQYAFQQRLFYQLESGNLVAADWVSGFQIADADISGKSAGWNLNEGSPLATLDMLAPITSFSYGASVNTSNPSYGEFAGLPTVVDVLAPGSPGLTQVAWYPSLGHYNSSMTARGISGVQNYTSVATHAWGGAYVLQDGSVTEWTLIDDISLAWQYIGPVVNVTIP